MKTLKDFDKICACGSHKESHNPHYTDDDDLKAEAIKWIKEDIDSYKLEMGNEIGPDQIRWMERFNITEDDLK